MESASDRDDPSAGGRKREAGSASLRRRRRRRRGPSAPARRSALPQSGCRRARAWSRTQPTKRRRCAWRSRSSASSTAPFAYRSFSRKCVGEMVENGVIPVLPALVKHSEAPPSGEGDRREKFRRLEVEKTSEALGSLAVERERQHDSDNHDAISYLRYLLKRHEACSSSPSANGLIVRAAKAVTELVLGIGNGSTDILVRMRGGIPLLVELLDADDIYVQGAAAAALCMMASKNEENRNQVALISVLVFLNSNVEKDVLAAGGLQPIISLLSSSCVWSQMAATRLLRRFAAAKSVRKAIVWRGAVRPLVEMLRSRKLEARCLSASALWRLALNSDTQVGIAHEGRLLALLGLLDSESESLQDVAACALHTLLDNEDNMSDFITIGGFRKLQRGEFTGHVFKHLLLLMRTSENTIQGRAAVALAHLSHPTNLQMIFIDNNGLKLLLALLLSSCPEEQVDGALALFKLADKSMIVSSADADSPPAQVYLSEQYVNNARHSDVTFLVKSRQFYAHRICLSASSDTICAMFDGSYQEKDATSIEIPNIRWETFELMMRFMYSGSVDITPELAPELLRAADQYLIEALKRLCEPIIAQEISMETISNIYELFKDFHATTLTNSCILFILEHFNEFRHRYSHLSQEIVPAIGDYFSEVWTKLTCMQKA